MGVIASFVDVRALWGFWRELKMIGKSSAKIVRDEKKLKNTGREALLLSSMLGCVFFSSRSDRYFLILEVVRLETLREARFVCHFTCCLSEFAFYVSVFFRLKHKLVKLCQENNKAELV